MSGVINASKMAIADHVLWNMLSPKYLGRMLSYFADTAEFGYIGDVFEDSEYSDLVEERMGSLSREEVKNLFRPIMASAIRQAVQAQKVTINW
jgi:hypothetical protein